jgi:hypothetical protein
MKVLLNAAAVIYGKSYAKGDVVDMNPSGAYSLIATGIAVAVDESSEVHTEVIADDEE